MPGITYAYITTLVLVLYWNTILYATVDNHQYHVNYFISACYLLQQDMLPQFAVLRRHLTTPFSHTVNEVTLPDCQSRQSFGSWTMAHRPVVGDHIHLQMVLSVNNQLMNFHDRNMSQKIAYEVDNYPVTCPNPMDFSYEKRWYHTGVHTHCDGNIVHVHPWSAPNQLQEKFEAVMSKKRPAPTQVAVAPIVAQEVVHAASTKRAKTNQSNVSRFLSAMSKYNTSGSARDHMDAVSKIGAGRRNMAPRSAPNRAPYY